MQHWMEFRVGENNAPHMADEVYREKVREQTINALGRRLDEERSSSEHFNPAVFVVKTMLSCVRMLTIEHPDKTTCSIHSLAIRVSSLNPSDSSEKH